MVDLELRNHLLRDIRKLSDRFPVSYLELIQPHSSEGSANGSLVANAFDVFLDCNLAVAWPVAEIRELWWRSFDQISGAIVSAGEPDAGFNAWLWSQTQRRWTASHEIGYAINPYQMWQSALITGCAGEQVICSNPLLASVLEISRIASYVAEIAGTAENCENETQRCRQIAEESCRVRDAMDSQTASLDVEMARGKATLALTNYRRAEMKRVRLRSLADVVVCYELALIPHVHVVRPAGDMHPAEGMTHFRRVAVDLANFANSKATGASVLLAGLNGEPLKPVGSADRFEAAGTGTPTQGDALETTFWRKRLARISRQFESCEPIRMVMIREKKPINDADHKKILSHICEGAPNAMSCLLCGYGGADLGSICFYVPALLGMSKDDQNRMRSTLYETFKAAGIALQGMPKSLIDQCSPVGMGFEPTSPMRWAACLFDAALLKRPGFTPIEFDYLGNPHPDSPRPACQFATLEDVAASSVELIDWLLTAADRRNDEPPVDPVDDVLRRLPDKKMRDILTAMDELNATPTGVNVNAEQIAKKAIDPLSGSESIKDEMVSLKNMGLVVSQRGRGKGSRLTDLGLKVSQKIKLGRKGSTN